LRGTDILTSTPRAAAKKKPQARTQARKKATPKSKETAVKTASPPNKALLDLVLETLDDTKAENVVVIDLADKSSIADYMVVASGRSSRQVITMADNLAERLKQRSSETGKGIAPSVEGKSQGDWVLIDAGDVVVHLFRPEVRDFYGLEKMWALPVEDEDAPVASVAGGRGQALHA
jgi:ribosome-associated protein